MNKKIEEALRASQHRILKAKEERSFEQLLRACELNNLLIRYIVEHLKDTARETDEFGLDTLNLGS